MPPLYRILEVALYAMLNFLPFMLIALLPFRSKFRFSNPVTVLLVGIMTLVQMCLGVLAAFSDSNAAVLSAASTIIYAVFYFIAVDAHAGKIIFTLLMLSNIANFVVTASKCLEGIFFPAFALQDYRWSFSVFMILIEAACLIPLYFFVENTYTAVFETEVGRPIWWYLWLIPATFYFIWYYELYNSEKSSLQMALDPQYSVFLLITNLGSMLIYYLVVRLIREMSNNSALTERNYQLAMQKLQYDNLRDRINEARQAKHDIRHHVTVMDSYLNNGEYARLKEYLNGYKHSLPDDDTILFCRHYTVNALLLYFAQQAKNNQVDFDVMIEIPENVNIPDHALCVVFGNLLENALEACLGVNDRQRAIIIRGKTSPNAIFLEIDNTYSGTVNKNAKGHYLSTKHSGTGIGLTSVQSLVAEYDGILEITHENGMFRVSALVNIPPE